jgi:hypothetical protein
MNPCPLRVGGGKSETHRAYDVIRSAVGRGGSAPYDSMEDSWRRARARGLAAATSAGRRAVYDYFPHLTTDGLRYHERVLGITPPVGSSEAARRDVVVEQWTAQFSATIPSLTEQLQRIDSRFSIIAVPSDQFVTTVMGEAFGPDFGGIGYSVAPNYSTGFVLHVLLDVGPNPPPTVLRAVERAKRLLRRRVPSWVDYHVVTSVGFILDTSPLDLTGL